MSEQIGFDFARVHVPDIRTPAPSAPGSASSRRGARAVEPRRPSQFRRILLALHRHGGAMTRVIGFFLALALRG